MDVEITTLAERPKLTDPLRRMFNGWPEFMLHDPVSEAYFGQLPDAFPQFTLVATDAEGEVVARGHSAPFVLAAPGRSDLPAAGWDQVLAWAFADHRRAAEPDIASALEIAIHPDWRGRGLSVAMLAAMRDTVRAQGFSELLAPVRPTDKHREPATPMAEYIGRVRPDGLPADAWLRTHVKAGGVIESVAPVSMVIPGSLAQWREWTGLPFDGPGWVHVPGALVPIRCVPEHDYAVYVEPNVWVRHRLCD